MLFRDYGPALASQLERKVSSALTIDLGRMTVSYNLHSLDQAGIWQGGFLDLADTQHQRPRGEGTANPQGESVAGFQGWQWGHDGTLDYPRQGLLPRGPLPKHWLDYHGHYLHGQHVVLSYAIDGREILELPLSDDATSIRRRLRIGPGKELILAVAAHGAGKVVRPGEDDVPTIAIGSVDDFTAAGLLGDRDQMRWNVDAQKRLVLRIPNDNKTREIEIVCKSSRGRSSLLAFETYMKKHRDKPLEVDFDELVAGGPLQWPDTLHTVGYRGLEQGAYASIR